VAGGGVKANPEPMVLRDPLDYEDARAAMKAAGANVRAAENELSEQIGRAADAEAEFRRALASKVITLRADGNSATLAETLARGSDEVLTYSRARDVAAGMVKFRHEVLEDRRGDRASLHKLVDYSMKVTSGWEAASDARRAAA
jgi:VIT1/CCC1 family predicted Fe2+/Mn2+ transporter